MNKTLPCFPRTSSLIGQMKVHGAEIWITQEIWLWQDTVSLQGLVAHSARWGWGSSRNSMRRVLSCLQASSICEISRDELNLTLPGC